MYDHKDIILAVDYHAENTEVRWLNCHSGEERRLNIPTTRSRVLRLVEKAITEAAHVGGKVTWIMESTTGWAWALRFCSAPRHGFTPPFT